MNEVGTLVGVSVGTDIIDSAVLDAARSCLEGFTGDYYLFAYDNDDYCLVMADESYFALTSGSYYAEFVNPQIVQFHRHDVSTVHHQNLPFSGSFNGTVTGIESGGVAHGSISGNTDNQYTVITSTYSMMTYSRESVKVANPDNYLVYGSAPYMPHLIEGVQNYAFAAFALCIGILSFRLCDRIFRRVY